MQLNLAKFVSLSSSFIIHFHIEFHNIRRVRSFRILLYIFFKKAISNFIVFASRLSFCQTFNLCILAKQGGGKSCTQIDLLHARSPMISPRDGKINPHLSASTSTRQRICENTIVTSMFCESLEYLASYAPAWCQYRIFKLPTARIGALVNPPSASPVPAGGHIPDEHVWIFLCRKK